MTNRTVVNSGFNTWNVDQLPDLTGKTYLITGGNAGLGFQTAKYLGAKGANLILACRSLDKAARASSELRKTIKGNVEVLKLDLSDLACVRDAAEEAHQRFDKLDGLINNAGIMQCPKKETKDGFEMQVGTNHLGHFLFSGLMLDLVEAGKGRFVTLTSLANRVDGLKLDDFMSDKDYSPNGAYVKSKISNLMFALELDYRLRESGSSAISIACHPGYSNTNLQNAGPKGLLNAIYKVVNPLFAQQPEQGALSTVLAAAGKEAVRGAYYGPQRMWEMRGPVGDAQVGAHILVEDTRKLLWEKSEDLVNFKWSFSKSF
ncbi:SDR family NAD(P)-dependent oxidoreductase [Vibrio parahaemolyticus]|nr:SDR family NAD(P)-dependent oxidoreductase [Vibrio alginolyticus]ELA9388335.1 SDR family NAD(P)-dependent oxidoreductase [Vibrio parahaemolyticus]MBE4058676.1 SDR family NAD(P)-dependent oxidoreductase [Vibrio parahaemolyticus]RFD37323.1 short-chain dehydrogenase [Vibrio parahaemolyticus]